MPNAVSPNEYPSRRKGNLRYIVHGLHSIAVWVPACSMLGISYPDSMTKWTEVASSDDAKNSCYDSATFLQSFLEMPEIYFRKRDDLAASQKNRYHWKRRVLKANWVQQPMAAFDFGINDKLDPDLVTTPQLWQPLTCRKPLRWTFDTLLNSSAFLWLSWAFSESTGITKIPIHIPCTISQIQQMLSSQPFPLQHPLCNVLEFSVIWSRKLL